MKNKNHGLSEKEMELVKLLMAECETTADIQNKLKKLFAGTIEERGKTIKADNGFLFKSDDQPPVPRYMGSAGNLGGTVPNASARAIMGLPPEPTK